MACKNFEQNKTECPCAKTDCDNFGTCCDCIRAHRKAGVPVACMKEEALAESKG